MVEEAYFEPTEAQRAEFDRLARRYSWDIPLPDARDWPDRPCRHVKR